MRMELQPVLRGPRLKLRPLKPADFDALYAAAKDPEIWKLHPASDRWKPDVFEAFFDGALKSKGALVVELDGNVVGTSRYYDAAPPESVAIGFTFLVRSLWGGDYNAELKRLMLDHAFAYCKRAVFHVGEHNVRSRKAMEKIGGKLVGRLDRTRPDGSPDPTVVYEISRP